MSFNVNGVIVKSICQFLTGLARACNSTSKDKDTVNLCTLPSNFSAYTKLTPFLVFFIEFYSRNVLVFQLYTIKLAAQQCNIFINFGEISCQVIMTSEVY